jgi:tetratricopeptide (TPR) repeat protein
MFLFVLLPASLLVQAPANHKDHITRDYKMTPMPPPKRLTGIGNSHLQIITKSPEAQIWFDQGLNLLHCFWEFEAYRAFKEAARVDPDAAMAWWGIARSISDYKSMSTEREAAMAKARELLPKVSEHEQLYIRAQEKEKPEEARREMEALMDKFPDDIDAKLFFALSRPFGYENDGRPRDGALYSHLLIRDVLRRDPDSAAAHHYMIHLLESSLHAEEAVPNAEALTRLAPGSGHMIHMPGHIYFRVGQYDRARESFLASKKFEEDYMQREHVSTIDDWNYPHNLSYLIASDAESGRFKEALQLAALLDSLPANPFLGMGAPTHAVTVGATAIRLKMRYGDYDAAVENPIKLGFEDETAGASAAAFRDGMAAYARGMRDIKAHRLEEAARELDALDAISWRTSSAKTDDKDDNPTRVLLILETASLDLRGNLLAAQHNWAQSIDLLKTSVEKDTKIGYNEPPQYARPQLESLGYVFIAAGRYAEARDTFQRELIYRPRSGFALYGIAQSWEAQGNRAEAARAYRDFLDAWNTADPDLTMMVHARENRQ